jgi:hypothetical protein
VKGDILETTINNGRRTRVATIPQYAALKGVSVDKVVGWVKRNRITALRHNGKTVIDVDASEEDKQPQQAQIDEDQVASPEVLLQRLLVQAEASAQKSHVAQKRWQLVSFVSLMFFIGALWIIIWLYMDVRVLTLDQDRLRMDKYTLAEQLHSARAKVSDINGGLNLRRDDTARFGVFSAGLGNRNKSLSVKVDSLSRAAEGLQLTRVEDKPVKLVKVQTNTQQTERTPLDPGRLNSIRKGTYPEDMTRAELIASLGEPDRIYKGGQYEQLVYFDRSPGRFWFRNGPFVQVAD